MSLNDNIQQISTEVAPQDTDVATTDDFLNDNTEQISTEAAPQDTDVATTDDFLNDNTEQNCKHDLVSTAVSSLDKCSIGGGPFSALKWICVRCKVCSCFWPKSCYDKSFKTSTESLNSEEQISSEELASDDDYVPDSCSHSDSSRESEPILTIQKRRHFQENLSSEESPAKDAISTVPLDRSYRKGKQVHVSEVNKVKIGNAQDTSVKETTDAVEGACIQSSNISSSVIKKNYCYICGKPQSKFTRHLKIHEKDNFDVAQVLALPKNSKERKKILDKLQNKGNHKHNTEVLRSGTGLLKLRRKPKNNYGPKDYVHCMYLATR
ncbi:uncharacterized protein [Trachinotus anak]|uniref:uncharacterized protein isoform X1 n=1 Tax=Trachinotus anak TaxID=443729 RepID=UPI0039F1FAEF